ncbi:MAG: homocysteine S-methyltransferase family protein [Lachnospiraceae bacterium]|nr:homocysteine S-methyltransferase family protein [Lachnospiraceae bacterium]
MGSNMQKAGMKSGVCPEKWMLEHPEAVLDLQSSYVKAGTNALYAPTFTANGIKLAEYGLEKDMIRINEELVALSRQAAGKDGFVLGDVTMTGLSLTPIGKTDFDELLKIYIAQVDALVKAGVDGVVVETMMSLQETRAAILACKEVCPELPILATLTFDTTGRTLYGTDGATAAVVLSALGVTAFGANCSCGPSDMVPVIRKMADYSNLPIIAKPNAGMPVVDDAGNSFYDLDAEGFAKQMIDVFAAGATVIGGCCGSDPAYIRVLKDTLGGLEEKNRPLPEEGIYLSSERKVLKILPKVDPFHVVGERINPTGKKKLQAELKEGKLDLVLQYAQEQETAGAVALDVNVGMSGIDELSMMRKVTEAVSSVTQLPLVLDNSNPDVLEDALRRYPGRALINSVSAEQEKMDRMLPLVKKYGAVYLLLPVSESGIPETTEEKMANVHRVLKEAEKYGLTKKDVIVDGLVTTVGANPKAGKDFFDTIRLCTEEGLATICGLSNISFGLPDRMGVNANFLSMAIMSGLTMAIANPMQDQLMESVYAANLLLNKEGSADQFVAFATAYDEKKKSMVSSGSAKPSEKKDYAAQLNIPESYRPFFEDILNGNTSGMQDHIRAFMESLTVSPEEKAQKAGSILDESLMPAIRQVGEFFDKGVYFLPQLITGAQTMEAGVAALEPYFAYGPSKNDMPTIVIATVEGDVHDIGKNLVALMLRNDGFNVIDLGKNVPADDIINEAEKRGAQLIGLSALMTTTMPQMKVVVDKLEERGLTDIQVMVGGACVTPEYAKEIKASYSKDASEAVKVAERLTGIS